MRNLFINATKRTPQIDFRTNGELTIVGSSLPENAKGFYTPVIDWLDEFKLLFPSQVSLVIDVDYFNTSSTRIVLKILKLLNNLQNLILDIVWVYEQGDEDMLEQGQILSDLIERPFRFEEKELVDS
ncbi:MAG: SiaC family regulatory phosphoprotein [Bacteroidota bacterium]|nr:SiaC family regulatory phosphoprotein [Bacteroidota bacterium]